MSDLYRAEIISNQSVEEDIIERLEEAIASDSDIGRWPFDTNGKSNLYAGI